jgi:glycosyltransferase 2 family protein
MRSSLLLLLRVLVSLGLLYISFGSVHLNAVLERLGSLHPAWLLLAVFFTFCQILLAAQRWHDVSNRSGAPLSGMQAFRFNMIGTFFNQTLPSSIGGDAMRLWLLARITGWRQATYSVLVDRAIGLIALASIIICSLPWSFTLIKDEKGRLALLSVDFAAVGVSVGFLVVGALSWPWLKRWWPLRHFHACGEIANKALFGDWTGLRIAGVSLAIHVLTVVTTWCCVQAIDAPASFQQLFLLVPPIMLITMLPISIAGWGIREAAMMTAFGYAGLAQADGTIVSILFGAVTFIVGAAGGLVWIGSSEKSIRTSEVIPKID